MVNDMFDNTFCCSIWKMILIFFYFRLVDTSNGIPRPRPEDFEEKESDEIDYRKLYAQKNKAAEKSQGLCLLPSFLFL